ncbi:hypothetical protein [Okeania sp. SIO2C9]|uniref:hypothetical protein n=1 Tax=Okeania sp. SIO2C9 TaxID=2607791 RepID=UPI0025E65724|nr:hypothetical protein [Okeania sp. SIO2C9]
MALNHHGMILICVKKFVLTYQHFQMGANVIIIPQLCNAVHLNDRQSGARTFKVES